jgi:hypothetical protein
MGKELSNEKAQKRLDAMMQEMQEWERVEKERVFRSGNIRKRTNFTRFRVYSEVWVLGANTKLKPRLVDPAAV